MAERYSAIREFFDAKPEALHPVTRNLIAKGRGYSASDAFEGIYRLEELKKITGKTWNEIDMLVVPTTGTTYSIAEVESDPFALNNHLSFYTNFMNLLDLCGLAVPNGFYANGLPAGVTFIAPALQESGLCALGAAFQRESGLNLGATSHPIPAK
jgi:allophanate hydrolase